MARLPQLALFVFRTFVNNSRAINQSIDGETEAKLRQKKTMARMLKLCRVIVNEIYFKLLIKFIFWLQIVIWFILGK